MKRRESKPAAPRAALLDAQWASQLSPELRRRVLAETVTRKISLGSYVCRKGDPAKHWIGVLGGLVKVASVSPAGKPVSFICVPAGGWFGEGALLKNERRLYDAVALRPSVVAYMPRATFMLLADTSVTFNRFLVTQLNERLGQFVAMVEHDRLLGPEARRVVQSRPVSRESDVTSNLARGTSPACGTSSPARQPGAEKA